MYLCVCKAIILTIYSDDVMHCIHPRFIYMYICVLITFSSKVYALIINMDWDKSMVLLWFYDLSIT